MTGLLPLVLIFVVFWLLLIRPQQKKAKEHKAMVAAVRRGDRVVTGGGVFGTVTKVVSDTEVQVEIAEGVKVRVVKGTIGEVIAKTEPGKAKGGKEEAKPAAPMGEGGIGGALSKLFGGGAKKN